MWRTWSTTSEHPLRETDRCNDWTPYRDRVQFEVADFLYRRNQMSAGDINLITGLWAASLAPHNDSPPFKNAKDLYDTIVSPPLGNAPWQSFTLNYNGPPMFKRWSLIPNLKVWFHTLSRVQCRWPAPFWGFHVWRLGLEASSKWFCFWLIVMLK